MAQTENPARERILEKIRTALREPAPRHPSMDGRKIFAPVENPLDRFQKECAANITECTVTPDLQESARFISGVLAQLPPGEIFIQDSSMLRRMSSAWQDGRTIRWSSEGAPHEASQATITHAEALVALTGSALVSSSCGGRGATVVAPVHIVVATLDQLVPDLEAVFTRIREREIHMRNSYVCLITGSSRTADIEKILVMGAHGPVRLLVVLSRTSNP
jgi:L-lactate dehydrogenase complex protein LldG